MTNPRLFVLACLVLCGGFASIGRSPAQHSTKTWSPVIPKTWDDEAMLSLELPLADPAASPKHVSSDYYYRIPVRPIYKSYPVYYPANEPAAYIWTGLRSRNPRSSLTLPRLRQKEIGLQPGSWSLMPPLSSCPRVRCFQKSEVPPGGNNIGAWSNRARHVCAPGNERFLSGSDT